jgi:hypothetical protein
MRQNLMRISPSNQAPNQSGEAAATSSPEPPIAPKKSPNYKINDPAKPVGTTVTLGDDLVRKWVWYRDANELEPIWPSQHHKVSLNRRGWEGGVRIIYDPDTHSIITRTITTPQGDVAPNSLDLQREAFLAVSQNDRTLHWMPDGSQYIVGKTEIAHIPAEVRSSLVTREQASECRGPLPDAPIGT